MDEPSRVSRVRPLAPTAPDKRRSVRYSCILEVSCLTTEAVEYTASLPAVVVNISTGGICLLLTQTFPLGTILTIGLEATTQGFLPPLQVRVVHAHQRANGDWVLGVAFLVPLSEEELEAILA